ncbi:MAG TPA: glycosyltransferase [Polyangium sp.]|nr:glycosyltransferase [Polyangium sp.]
MKKALLVSYYFPPRFSIGGKRAFRFARYLPEFDWSTVVLTARGPASERLDPTFQDLELPHCEIHRDYLTDSEIADLPKRSLGSDGTISEPTKMWGRAIPRFSRQWWANEFRFSPIVGPALLDIPRIARRIADLARRTHPDVIWATGSPWETVVAATIAARDVDIPFILDFRDPWSFGLSVGTSSTFLRVTNSAIEAAILRRAAMLTVTSEMTRDEYATRGAARRVECIRNGYDPAIRVVPRTLDRFTVVHFGNCYANRTLAPFLRAAARAIEIGPIDRKNFKLLNLGRVSEQDVALVQELGIADIFEYQTVLPYEEGLSIVAGADLALLLAFGDEPWFIPGKLYDYAAVRTPILSLSTSPELDGLVERSGLGWVHPATECDALAQRIVDVWKARRDGLEIVAPNDEVLESLSARNGARELSSLFDDVMTNTERRAMER